jgi:hypothetical protein
LCFFAAQDALQPVASGCGNDSLAAAAHPSSAASAFIGPLSVSRDAQAINLPLGLPAHALH